MSAQTLAPVLHGVFFDLDGTLLDTAPDLCRCANQVLVEEGREPMAEVLLREQVSNGASAMLKTAFCLEDNTPELERLRARMLDIYESQICVDTRWFDGMESLITAFETHQIRWGIVTNKPARFATPLMKALGVDLDRVPVICPDHVAITKPHPKGLTLAAQQTGCEIAHSVYVGDHLRDIQAGQNAGMATIAAAWGYLSDPAEVHNWGATWCATAASELLPLLKSHYQFPN